VGNAECFGAFTEGGECVAFNSIRTLPHPTAKNIKQGHRLVVLPDYQGLGLGWRFDEWMGEWLHRRGWRYHNTTSHPAMIAAFLRSPRWRTLGRAQSLKTRTTQAGIRKQQTQVRRLGTYSFAYQPPVRVPSWLELGAFTARAEASP